MARHKRKKRRILFKIFVVFQLLLMVAVVAGLLFYFFGGYGEKISAMQKEAREFAAASTEQTFRAVETSLVYDDNGQLISTLKGEKDVYYLEYEEIPEYTKAAIVSIEDKKFYSHPGFDLKAIFRAAKALLENGEVTQGGSTITQQLARTIFLTQDRTWERKVEEIFLAVELERKYSKRDILEFYLNNIYFGNGYYGIQAASKGYFGKEVKELTLSQQAFLCAIPNRPNYYDPLEHMDHTLQRRDRILEQMSKDGKITEVTCHAAQQEEIVLQQTVRNKHDYVETYIYYCATRVLMEQQGFVFRTEFVDELDREEYQQAYEELYGSCQASLYQKGYRIYTSIDMEMQTELQEAVDGVLAGYTETNEEGVYTLQGSAVCIDNHNGMVKAIVGGRDQGLPGYTLNRAYQSFRQPGSAVKPLIVYTPALERGYHPDSVVVDEAIEEGPQNADGYYGGEMTLRFAVEKSKNTIAWKLLEELTPEVGLQYLRNMNFAKLSPDDLRLPSALGGFTTGVSAVEMASAYSAIENDGLYRRPGCVKYITDAEGNMLYEAEPLETRIYDQNAARMMTDMLKGVLVTGTGKGLALTSMSCAGKTGTTNDNKDGWFVGYTPYYTTSVWVGYDMPKELPGLSGSTYPGLIWNHFMETIHQGLESMEFLPYIPPERPEEEEPEEEDPEGDESGEGGLDGDETEEEDPDEDGSEEGSPEGDGTEGNSPEGSGPGGDGTEGNSPEDGSPGGDGTEGNSPEGGSPGGDGTEGNSPENGSPGDGTEGSRPEEGSPGGGSEGNGVE
ncbi:MAG: PBP1A family penicillin-binding protein [Lachnospiraceae bacterium]|nr:PBP1A family penicillin-binding protein [Lachnospiraceae bacterium]